MRRPGSSAGRLRRALAAAPREPQAALAWLELVTQCHRLGWDESLRRQQAVDMNGGEIPWFTYPATRWLAAVLRQSDRVFEYGSGTSTCWFTHRCTAVVSVEHDQHHAQLVSSYSEPNITLITAQELSLLGYAEALPAQKKTFDIVVVDVHDRATALAEAFKAVEFDGVVILDDSDRPETRNAMDAAGAAGWPRIDFFGPRPGLPYFSTTSAFMRPNSSRLFPATVPGWSGY